MKLNDIEQKIKDLIAQDVNNPEIYENIQKLVYGFLKRYRMLSVPSDLLDLSYMVAGDLYMKILKGEEIRHWIGYISVVLRGGRHKYLKDHCKEYVDTRGNISLNNAIREMVTSKSTQNTYQFIHEKDYLGRIGCVIREILKESRYYENTPIWNNLYLSLLLSLISEKEVYYNLDPIETEYLSFLIRTFKSRLKSEIKNLAEEDEYASEAAAIQYYNVNPGIGESR